MSLCRFSAPLLLRPRATPAGVLGISHGFGIGHPAEFVIFRARTMNELLSRPQPDRRVIRGGGVIDTTLPDYAELDDRVA